MTFTIHRNNVLTGMFFCLKQAPHHDCDFMWTLKSLNARTSHLYGCHQPDIFKGPNSKKENITK